MPSVVAGKAEEGRAPCGERLEGEIESDSESESRA